MTATTSAWHYDGKVATRRRVTVAAEDERLTVDGEAIDPTALVGRGIVDGAAVYAHRTITGWRLGLDDTVPPEVAALLPHEERYGRVIDRHGLWPAAIAFALVACLVVFVVLRTPQWLAPLVPPAWERQFGDALVGDFGGRFCSTPEGDAALARLTRALDPASDDLQVHVANIGMVNAVAMPGNHVVLFDGLVRRASGPDEVAGVLAHEIGHARNRDVMQALLRQLGLSVVLGGASDAGGYLNAVMSTTYTRNAENRADDFAIAALQRARISPDATAGFFRRLANTEGQAEGRTQRALGYLSSHPMSGDRERKFRGAVTPGMDYRPALSPAEWNALRRMCRDDANVRSGGFPF